MIVEDEDGNEIVQKGGRTEVRFRDGRTYIERADGQAVWYGTVEERMSPSLRLKLVGEVYGHVFAATETFAVDDIGIELAYLLGAIARNGQVELEPGSALRRLLDGLGAGHPVWHYVTEGEGTPS